MSNRLTRDQILARALDEVDSVALDAHDRPGGSVLAPQAFSIVWLQDGLDNFHRVFPMAGRLTDLAVILNATGSLTVPDNFILDVRDGLIIPSKRVRVTRKGFQDWLNYQMRGVTNATEPSFYTRQGSRLLYTPAPREPVTATLWYYALPSVMDENDKPDFPDDWTLVEYVRLRGMEYIKAMPPGSAQKYVQESIAVLRGSMLFGDPEHDTLPLDPIQFPRAAGGMYDWMGVTVANQ